MCNSVDRTRRLLEAKVLLAAEVIREAAGYGSFFFSLGEHWRTCTGGVETLPRARARVLCAFPLESLSIV